MGRLAVIILALTAVLFGVNGLTEEIENLVNLQDNIHEVIGDQ
jgi:hypothetical protein